MYINVIGAGLAGCECAYQIAKRGINVRLFEMKPTKKTAAHKSDLFCELICSNSLKALRIESAAGLLKEEMRRLDSLLMRCADKCAVPAGGALAVNRDDFSAMVTQEIKNNPLIEVIEQEVTKIPQDSVTVIAAGPLAKELAKGADGEWFESVEQVKSAIPALINEGDTVLVKASHSMHFEEIVDFLKEQF